MFRVFRRNPERSPGKSVLIVDCNFPRPLHDSGSMDLDALIHSLLRQGCKVSFLALGEYFLPREQRDRNATEEYRAWGVTCLTPGDDMASPGWKGIEEALQHVGPNLDTCIPCRVSCGGAAYDRLRAAFPSARMIFYACDLHFLREERAARLAGDYTALKAVEVTRDNEFAIMRRADATLVVSSYEKNLLRQELPEALVVHLAFPRPSAEGDGWDARRDIGFIGNFGHRPNEDAVRYFLEHVWPDLAVRMPDCRFLIVGAGAPDWLTERAQKDARLIVLGHVPDLAAVLNSLRITVAPLRYGAGTKGKVLSSLSHGVPCVMTSVAAEGFDFTPQLKELVVADLPQDVVDAIVALYTQASRWEMAVRHGRDLILQNHTPEKLDAALAQLLRIDTAGR
ncbi:glycosyltransferase [Gluconobacter cerinus]|uniref:glycosyltransferase n=1 Tax=Gluconobacter cerinus TaxID=38307 RepID=UPI001B8C7C4F|nr:glycosyltransferase family 4 protein [Gluconobacter cerinus]MBS1017671.1 glycosyltransferase [Gluconobacter cerinus]